MNKVNVSIYQIVGRYSCFDLEEREEPEVDSPFADLSIELACLAVVAVDATENDTDQRLCARAWVEAVGLTRRVMFASFGAPDVILAHEVDIDQIAGELVRAPEGLSLSGPTFQLDAVDTTWFLCAAPCDADAPAETRLVRSRYGGRPSLPLSLVRGPAALIRSLAYPNPN